MSGTVSVIIPNYNNARFLKRCVESVISQTYERIIEIIIVDDCSTDNSKDVINELKIEDSRVKSFFLAVNGKVSNARNNGLAIAKGEYVTFIDADDYYYNINKIKNEMALIQHHVEYGENIVAYSPVICVDYAGEPFDSISNAVNKRYLDGKIYLPLLLGLIPKPVIRDYCIETDFLKQIGGYNVERNLFEDLELLYKIAKKRKFYHCSEVGTAYRNNPGGLSKEKKETLVKEYNTVVLNQIKNESGLSGICYFLLFELMRVIRRLMELLRR